MRNRPTKPATFARSHAGGLTLTQQSAVDLLAAGKTDTEAAELLGVNRCSVTRWRLYSPEFQATLAVRRADVWGSAAARLRALLPKAVDALADALDAAPVYKRAELALSVLKLAGPLTAPAPGPFDPDDYVRAVVDRERAAMGTNLDRLLEQTSGLPEYAAHLARVREKLAALSAGDADDAPPPPTRGRSSLTPIPAGD